MGTAGHMAHPFDVERILTGQDLIDYINDAVLRLQNKEITGSVKWEGINTSFKLVTNEDGSKEFRMDRGTSEIGSVLGFDVPGAIEKWGQEHGMAKAIPKLLNIFNEALPLIESELKKLGMWDDPTKYFNTEYIEGRSNVIDYSTMDIPSNILAIHGINQFYEKKAQSWRIRAGKSMDRPGLERPIDPETNKPDKEVKGIEIPYDRQTLATLIEKVQPIADASKPAFKIYGDVPVEFDPEVELDLEGALDNTQLSVEISPDDIQTYSLREWLKSADNPKDKMITRADGKQIGAMSKDAYLAVLRSAEEGSPSLKEYLATEEDAIDAINGAVFYHTLRVLGQQIKSALTSEVGNLSNHEGVVLRGLEDFLVKFTGEFIVQGLASTHGDRGHMIQEEEKWAPLDPDWRRNYGREDMSGYTPHARGTPEPVEEGERIAVIAGGFKPPHQGHLQMVEFYADRADKVKLYIGAQSRPLGGSDGEINADQSRQIWEAYLEDAGISDKVEIDIVPGSPMKLAYKALEEAEPGQTIIMGCGEKDTYYSPDRLAPYVPEGVNLEAAPCPNIVDPNTDKPFKAEYAREAIRDQDIEKFAQFVPQTSQHRIEELFDILSTTLEEMSSASGGSNTGSGGGLGIRRGRKEDDKKEKLVNEVMDYLLGITVG